MAAIAPSSGRFTATLVLLLFALAMLATAAVSMTLGTSISLPDCLREQADLLACRTVLLDLRLPRTLLALAAGATLAQAGVALQALFRNPLADVALLGVSGGAALGAALWMVALPLVTLPAMLADLASTGSLPLAAGLGALAAVGLVLGLARRSGRTELSALLLAGIAVNAFAGAGLALIQTLASDRALRNLTGWLYGNLGRADWPSLSLGIALLGVAVLVLAAQARQLDVLLLGEIAAQHLGIDPERLKRRLLAAVIVIAAVTVSLAGIIGFVGLIVPHLLRGLFGARHAWLMPASALAGATLLCAADALARSVAAPLELPVGIITALLGVPVLVALLARHRTVGLG